MLTPPPSLGITKVRFGSSKHAGARKTQKFVLRIRGLRPKTFRRLTAAAPLRHWAPAVIASGRTCPSVA